METRPRVGAEITGGGDLGDERRCQGSGRPVTPTYPRSPEARCPTCGGRVLTVERSAGPGRWHTVARDHERP